MSKKLLLIVIFFAFLQVPAQELPPVENFGPNTYTAGNQNWMIAQADNKNLYFANSTGLLEYNGENWNLYPVPNNTIVRSLKIVGDRIYTGAYMEAGYWEENEQGSLEYTSLASKLEGLIGDGEQFWDIEYLDNILIFRSNSGIYFYDPERGSIKKMEIPAKKSVVGIFTVEKQLYFQLAGGGLYKIFNGDPQIVIPQELLGSRTIVHLYFKGNTLHVISGRTEFMMWDKGFLSEESKPVNKEIGNPNILDAINLPNGNIVLGTVGEGVIEIDSNGNIVNAFNQENVLLNNTVLDLFVDKENNLWAGLDYGISSIYLNSSFRSFQDNRGEIGAVYASLHNKDDLYLGTNQGLYLRKAGKDKFQLIPGTNGQVWFIHDIDGQILCGHDEGTFLINGDKAKKIADRLGTWMVKKYTDDILIQGHYNGISFLRILEGKLEALPKLPDFPHSSKFIEVDDEKNIWISNEHKGVFRLKLGDSLNVINEIENYKFFEGSGITSSLLKFNDTIYYSSKENIYQFRREQNNFTRENGLNDLISGLDRITGKMVSEEQGTKLWGFSDSGIFSIQKSRLSKNYDLDNKFIAQEFRNIAVGYENITPLGKSNYLLGTANGYLKFNSVLRVQRDISINLDKVEVSSLEGSSKAVLLGEPGDFEFERNNISFHFSAPVHDKYLDAIYSYRLVGLSENWSAWNDQPVANFKNLGFGDYKFEVKARVGNSETEIDAYQFYVQRPYYLSVGAMLGYITFFICILYGVHLINRRHHRKMVVENERDLKLKNLQAEQEIIKLRNEKLEQDMTNKNRELAVSTMSMIKKNEFLTSIKEKLKDAQDSSKVKSVIKTIDKDINEEDNWNFFKKAFSNADKDFFQNIKSKHPELTSNDLKLCAYLRLNLSSKEIAPLLNISVKSVEIKRYRLRKKMELDRETNLTEYILAL